MVQNIYVFITTIRSIFWSFLLVKLDVQFPFQVASYRASCSILLFSSFYRKLSLPEEESNIACVCCHPTISGVLLVALQNGHILSYSPLLSVEPRIDFFLPSREVYPLSMCFGSSLGSDQFSLYLLLNNCEIMTVFPLPLEGYRLPFPEYCSILKEEKKEVNDWLYTWKREEKEDVSVIPLVDSHMSSTVADQWIPNIVILHPNSSAKDLLSGELVV